MHMYFRNATYFIFRWADKSYSIIMFDNGVGGINSDHTPFDAMVNVAISLFIDLGVTDTHGVWPNTTQKDIDLPYERLSWKLDADMLANIERAKVSAEKLCNTLMLKRTSFDSFGKDAIVKLKVNPDTFVQMCIQLAYFRLHKRPGTPLLRKSL